MSGLTTAPGSVVLILGLVSFAGFAVYLRLLQGPTSLLRTSAKALAVGALSVLAFELGGPWLLAAALALSALGDAFLAHEGDAAFLGGLGSFLMAHILYAVLLASVGPGFTASMLPGLLAVVVFALAFGFVLVRKAGTLALPVAAYVIAIAAMVAGGVMHGGLALVGAILFMASDTILGAEKFLMAETSPARRLTAPAVWVLYYAGQVLITLGLLA